jgi:dihydrofolate reductase
MLWPGWSKQTTGDDPGPILNQMHKYVVSTTLSTAPWKESTIIAGNVIEEIRKLKQQPGKDIIMGRGRRFFPDGTPPTKLRLVESKTLSFGSLALVYQPDKK